MILLEIWDGIGKQFWLVVEKPRETLRICHWVVVLTKMDVTHYCAVTLIVSGYYTVVGYCTHSDHWCHCRCVTSDDASRVCSSHSIET